MKKLITLLASSFLMSPTSFAASRIESIPAPAGGLRVDVVLAQREVGLIPESATVVNTKGKVVAKLGRLSYPLGRWSPDGRYFAFNRRDPKRCAQLQWNASICGAKVLLFSALTSTVQFLTHGICPAFSSRPDTVVFFREFDRAGKKISARVIRISIKTKEEEEIVVFPPTYDFWGEIIDVALPSDLQVWASVGKPRMTQRGSTEMYEFFVYDRKSTQGPIERYRVQLEDDGRYHIGFK